MREEGSGTSAGLINHFLEAVRFLTILPVPGRNGKGDLARATFFFPLVGLLVGVVSIGITRLLSLDSFGRLESLAFVTLPILLTGGLHVDGFSDFCDGFFGGKGKDEVLRIMRDSRIGVWGALGILLAVFWKWELLASLARRKEVFVLALTASRWSQVVLSYFLSYANSEGGLGQSVAKKVGLSELIGASALLALLVFFLKGWALLCWFALLPFLAGLGFFFWKRVGGITGDLLGAASEATELFILLVSFLIQSVNVR